jgi:hypothetical protein
VHNDDWDMAAVSVRQDMQIIGRDVLNGGPLLHIELRSD